MFPILQLGPFVVQTPGLAIVAGLWVASKCIEKQALRLKLNAAAIVNMIFYAVLGGLVAARLAYAAPHWRLYLVSPVDLLMVTGSTLNLAAGLIVGLAIAVLIGWRQKLPLRPSLDALAPGLAVIMLSLGVADVLSGDAYGLPSGLPWAIYIRGAYRQPTQFYEVVAALGILLLWWLKRAEWCGSGQGFLVVVALSAAARVIIEAFRADSLILPGGFRLAQVIGLAVLALSIYVMVRWRRGQGPASVPDEDTSGR